MIPTYLPSAYSYMGASGVSPQPVIEPQIPYLLASADSVVKKVTGHTTSSSPFVSSITTRSVVSPSTVTEQSVWLFIVLSYCSSYSPQLSSQLLSARTLNE